MSEKKMPNQNRRDEFVDHTMLKTEYNKLVRDAIPEIIKSSGKSCVVSTLNDADYQQALKAKLVEESQEVLAAETKQKVTEEIADVIEVIKALQSVYGIDSSDVAKFKSRKAAKNGKFDKRIFLHNVTEYQVGGGSAR